MVGRVRMIETANSEKDLGVQISVAWTLRNSQPRSQSAAHIGPSFTVGFTILSRMGGVSSGKTRFADQKT